MVFVRHDSQAPESPLFYGSPGNAFRPEVDGEPDLLVVKHGNSAFYGSPNRHRRLRENDHHALTICGITTGELKYGRGIQVGHNAVELIMREFGIKGTPTRRLPGAPASRRSPRLISCGVSSLAIARSAMTDGHTEHPASEGKLYCCVDLGTFSRRVVG